MLDELRLLNTELLDSTELLLDKELLASEELFELLLDELELLELNNELDELLAALLLELLDRVLLEDDLLEAGALLDELASELLELTTEDLLLDELRLLCIAELLLFDERVIPPAEDEDKAALDELLASDEELKAEDKLVEEDELFASTEELEGAALLLLGMGVGAVLEALDALDFCTALWLLSLKPAEPPPPPQAHRPATKLPANKTRAILVILIIVMIPSGVFINALGARKGLVG